MRYALLLLAVPALLATGCSQWIRQAGRDINKITTRAAAHAEFGAPTTEGATDGKPFEQFRTHRKYRDDFPGGDGYAMGVALTFGLIELYTLPRELFLLTKRTVFGQDVRVTYREDGIVEAVHIDGKAFTLNQLQSK